MRDVRARELAQLAYVVADQLAESRVHGRDAPIQARKSHAGLGLLEERPEPGLALALRLLHAVSLADVIDQGQEPVLAFGGQAAHGRLDLDLPPVLGEERRFVAKRHVSTLQTSGELGGQLCAFFWRGEL